jgi:hypothetical protein
MWFSNLRWSGLVVAAVIAAGIGGTLFWQNTQARSQPAGVKGQAENRVSARRDDDAIWARHAGNLKRIGLALHNYLAAEGHFPPAAIMSQDGKPLLSWRVAILPYLEDYDGRTREDLFKQFHLDEAWDSPHNQMLLARMPAVFASPANRDARSFTTVYRGFVSQDQQAAGEAELRMMMRGMMGRANSEGMMGGMMRPDGRGGMYRGSEAMQKVMAGMMGGMSSPEGMRQGMMGGMMGSRRGTDARSTRRNGSNKESQNPPDAKNEQSGESPTDGPPDGTGGGAAASGGYGSMMRGGGGASGGYGAMMGGRGAAPGAAGGMMAGEGGASGGSGAMMGGMGPGGGGSGAMMGGMGSDAAQMSGMMSRMGAMGSEGYHPRALFRQNRGVPIVEITDGTSNTLMVVEAADAVAWTKADDLPFTENAPLPRLGGSMRSGFAALFADGRVQFVDQPIEDHLLRSLITPNGGEILSSDQIPGPGSPPPGGVTVTPAAQPQAHGLAADAERYAGAGTLLNAVGILRDKLNREGKQELAEWLSEAKARRSIRAGLQAYEAYLRRSGEPQEPRARFEILRPVYEQIAQQGAWPGDCWFSSTSDVETRERILYEHHKICLNVEGTDRGNLFQLSILILDIFSGPVDAQPAARSQ